MYFCKLCGYKTDLIFNYRRHNSSNKHKKKMKTIMEGSNDEKKSDKYDMVNEENEVSQKYHKGITEVSQKYHRSITEIMSEKKWKCENCDKKFSHSSNYYRHIKHYCSGSKEIYDNEYENMSETEMLKKKIEKLESENVKLVKEKYEALIEEKDNTKKELLAEKDRCINMMRERNVITNNTQNIGTIDNSRTTTYLNINLPNVIDIDTFINNLLTSHQLHRDQTKLLLDIFNSCGVTSYGNCLSRTLKDNCYQQMKDMELEGTEIKMIPIVSTDSNLRSHKEKYTDGWKKVDNDGKINKIINISNDQIYRHHEEQVYLDNKGRKKVGNILKKDHGVNILMPENNSIEDEKKQETLDDKNEINDKELNLSIKFTFDKNINEEEEEIIDKEIPEYDEEREYKMITDCGKKYVYDIKNMNVFSCKDNNYVGVLIHDEKCPLKHVNNEMKDNCWKYVEYC